MAETLFISDLHLDPSRPEIIELFSKFLRNRATQCDALYVLGDLFEYWIGDDQPLNGLESVIDGLQSLREHAVPVFFIQGNRDFLIGEDLGRKAGLKLLPDCVVIDLYGKQALLMHGDLLCTDDTEYQKLRSMLRDSQWQQDFLQKSLQDRIAQALALREQSMSATGEKSEQIMDVNTLAVEDAMKKYSVELLIHGHTHRPAIHDFTCDDRQCQRIVLGDWYDDERNLLRTGLGPVRS